jgi:hypothetical protein
MLCLWDVSYAVAKLIESFEAERKIDPDLRKAILDSKLPPVNALTMNEISRGDHRIWETIITVDENGNVSSRDS